MCRRCNGNRSDPEFRRKAAVKAAKSRTGPDYLIRKLTEIAPTLSGDQRSRLAEISNGGAGRVD